MPRSSNPPAELGEALLTFIEDEGDIAFGVVGRPRDEEAPMRWTASAEFGREAPDSPMRGGALYGSGETCREAIEDLLREGKRLGEPGHPILTHTYHGPGRRFVDGLPAEEAETISGAFRVIRKAEGFAILGNGEHGQEEGEGVWLVTRLEALRREETAPAHA